MGAYYTKKSAFKKYAQAETRILKVQGKAKAIGLLYLLAMLVVTALACLPLITVSGTTLGVMEFWKPFTQLSEGIRNKAFALAAAILYGIMLLILLVNVLKSFGKLNWLFKRKASRLYGFNRNMYAMDDIGRYFSGSIAAIVVCHLLIILAVGGNVVIQPLAFVLVAIAVVAHFALGLFAGNVSLFSTEGAIVEEKRELGNFSPFVRNLLQLVATIAITYFFILRNDVHATLESLVAKNGIKNMLADPKGLILPGIQFLTLVWIVGMFAYAFGTTEFDMQGKETPGRKTFLVLSILTLLTAIGAIVCSKLVVKTDISTQIWIIAGISLVITIAEICLLRCPKEETENLDEVEPGAYLSENYDAPGVYLTPTATQTMTYGAEAGYGQVQMRK